MNITFKIEQKVWLCVKNIIIERFSQRLNWLHYELYWIVMSVRKQVYRLELLKKLSIHDVFHVSLLWAHKSHKEKKFSESEFLHLALDSDSYEFEITAIVNLWVQINSQKQSMLQYLIAWKRYTDLIWESEVNIKNVWRLINKFHKKNLKKSKSTPAKLTKLTKSKKTRV